MLARCPIPIVISYGCLRAIMNLTVPPLLLFELNVTDTSIYSKAMNGNGQHKLALTQVNQFVKLLAF